MSFLPPIKIHIWGGLGSQLFAWALAEDLRRRYKSRKIEFVFHSGGVTRRKPELPLITDYYRIHFLDDFSSAKTASAGKDEGMLSILMLRMLKKILTFLSILASSNTNSEFNRIRPWVLIIRGHYSHREISLEVIQEMIEKINSSNSTRLPTPTLGFGNLGVHYRLGDLLTLSEKTHIASEQLVLILKIAQLEFPIREVKIYSDSPTKAYEVVSSVFGKEICSPRTLSTWDTVIELTGAGIFVGTNSKVSIWVALLRNHLNQDSMTFLPKQIKLEISRIAPNLAHFANCRFY